MHGSRVARRASSGLSDRFMSRGTALVTDVIVPRSEESPTTGIIFVAPRKSENEFIR